MKIILNPKRQSRGFILLLVILLAAFSMFILAGVMNRTSTVSLLNLRSTQLNVLDNAAEAACEKVFAKMAWDFQSYGPGQVTNNLANGVYSALVPTNSDNAYWSNFIFTDPITGNSNRIYVSYVTNYTGPLPAQFTNQFAYNSPILRIACNATKPNSLVPGVVGTAQEDLMLALVPITTYAIFYNGQLEFSGCATMTVSGRVHSNTNICVGAGSSSTLTFNDKVTSVAHLSAPPRATWSWTENTASTWLTTFNSGYVTNSPNVSLAIQMTNTHSLIEVPPSGESVMSQQGLVRLYNQAQVVLIITNTPSGTAPLVTMTLQTPYNGSLPGSDLSKVVRILTNATTTYLDTNAVQQLPFLQLDKTFADQRQAPGVQQFVTDIDVLQYKDWVRTNPTVVNKFTGGNYPTILYVADRRNVGTTTQSVVRLSNATSLPNNNGLGFTVATQNPLYVWGNYNTTVNSNTYATTVGSTTNGASVPAALLSDAITILSPNWTDANSTASASSRIPASMTVNAAIVTGNVPSTGTGNTQFSGGVHNLPRLLEYWSGGTTYNLTLNTSIVVLFPSQIATNQWQLPLNTSSSGYYNPPNRNWGFDVTYYSPNKQPPGVPCALVPIRYNWNKPAPGAVVSN
jgi:hypothetical protein